MEKTKHTRPTCRFDPGNPGRQTVPAICLLMLVPVLLLFSGCGYRFSGGGEMPGGVKRIAIEMFENRSGESGIESIITNDVVNEFSRNPMVEVTGREEADAVLTGVIRSARTRSLSHRAAYDTAEREIILSVDVRLATVDGKELWSARGIEASGDYAVADGGDRIRTEQNKKSAVADLSGRLAQRIFYQMTDRF